MNQQAIDILDTLILSWKELKEKFVIPDSKCYTLDDMTEMLEEAKSRIQALWDGWILWNDEKPVAKQLINMFNIHNGNINAWKVMQIEIDSKAPPYTHWMPISLPPNK